MGSISDFFKGRDTTPRPAPLISSTRQKILGSLTLGFGMPRDEYGKEIKSIREKTRKEYFQQKKEVKKNREFDTEQFERRMAKKERKHFGRDRFDIDRYKAHLAEAQKSGDQNAIKKAETKLYYQQKRADETWELENFRTREDRRLEWQRQDRERKMELRNKRHEMIKDLRDRSHEDNKAA